MPLNCIALVLGVQSLIVVARIPITPRPPSCHVDTMNGLFDLGLPIAYAWGILRLFRWADDDLPDDKKDALLRLISAKDYEPEKVASAILFVFDWVYTTPLLSLRAFVRSALLTLIISIIYIHETRWFDHVEFHLDDVIETFSAPLIVSIFSDYVTLFVIRSWLRVAVRRPIVALISSSLVAFVALLVGIILRLVALLIEPLAYDAIVMLIYSTLKASNFSLAFHMILQQIFMPVTLFVPAILVFAWLPMFGCGLLLMRTLNSISPIVLTTQSSFKSAKDRPLLAVGYVAAAMVFVGTVALRHIGIL
jgi:hypothetical protein